MSDESNALLALKNAWAGVVAASEHVGTLAPSVLGLDDATPIERLDLEDWHRVTMAQSIAVMSLRGLIEQLQRKYSSAEEPPG